MSELTLFDLDVSEYKPAKVEVPIDLAALADLAFCYTSTEMGNSSGIRFAMTVPDAQAWCESAISTGTLHGTRWAYFWTRVSTWVGVLGRDVDLSNCVDSGQWDDRITSLGLTKIHLRDVPALLEGCGVKVVPMASEAVA